MTKVPGIETSRLVLRGHNLEDFAALHAMWTEPAVYQHIIGRSPTREESWNRLLRYRGHWALLGYGFWAVDEQKSGHFIGEMGFADFHRDIEPPLDGTPEMGWALKAEAHGKGYATEALAPILEWGNARFGKAETACIISSKNTSSIRLAEKIGFRRRLETAYKGEPTLIFYRMP